MRVATINAAGGTLVAALLLIPATGAEKKAGQRYEHTRPLMGTMMRIVLFADSAESARTAADAAFDRIAELDLELSDYRDSSELMRLSRQAGHGPVKVGDDLFRVLRAAQRLYVRSGGAFDVTVGPLTVLWRRARRLAEMPDPARAAAARDLVGGDQLILDERQKTVTLVKPGMRLDLGGIAKGFAADEAALVLARHGITSALIAAAGDILATDPPPGTDGWRVGVASLDGHDDPPSKPVALAHAAISTSGDAEQFVVIDGVRYSHIIDPHTGQPMTRPTSATVIAADATTSDGLATAVAVLGPERGLRLVDDTPGAAAQVVVSDGPSGVHTYQSRQWTTRRTARVTAAAVR